METFPARKHPRRVSVRCTQCGDTDQINDRSHRRKVAEGKPHLCRMCRSIQSIKPTAADLHYWQSRYSQQEIDAMVGAII
jgi:hypothetical protein